MTHYTMFHLKRLLTILHIYFNKTLYQLPFRLFQDPQLCNQPKNIKKKINVIEADFKNDDLFLKTAFRSRSREQQHFW